MYNKKQLLEEIFNIENISEKITKYCPLITTELLINTLLKPDHVLKIDLGISAVTSTKYIQILWPDKPKTSRNLDTWLLAKYFYKECKKCGRVLDIDDFHLSKSRADGHSSSCKSCQLKAASATSRKRQAKYRAAKIDRIPSWMTEEELIKINKFYSNCPKGFQVDHIIPLQGKYVSGLHTIDNLQYLSIVDNIAKGNKYLLQ